MFRTVDRVNGVLLLSVADPEAADGDTGGALGDTLVKAFENKVFFTPGSSTALTALGHTQKTSGNANGGHRGALRRARGCPDDLPGL